MSGAALALAPGQKAATPAPAGLAQRRCACGGVVGPSGECAACRRKRLLGQGRTTAEQDPERERDELVAGVRATHSLACYGTGAVSVCNPATGNYDITGNNNTCCTHDCSQRHEQRHVDDLGTCCSQLHDRIAAGGDRNALVQRYNDWFDAGAHAWTECNAYGVSIACANELSASNHCSATGTPSQCCTEVADYLTNMRAQQTSWCASAPATLPICPFAPRVDTPRSTLPPGEAYA